MASAPIKSWSFSRLQDWENCKLFALLKHGERVPDPNPMKAADRGSMIHEHAEDFVRGKTKVMGTELAHFEGEFRSLANSFQKDPSRLRMEEEWGIDRDWRPTSYKSAWGRIKLDLMYTLRKDYAAVVDYKTGKKFGNETKHAKQLQLYSTTAFVIFDWLDYTTGEIWYLDQNELLTIHYDRKKAMDVYLPHWNHKAVEMTEATNFPPNPNIISCKYCPYGEDDTYDKHARYGPTQGTGHCNKRVVDKQGVQNFYQRMNARK